jgi:hypothetical protein
MSRHGFSIATEFDMRSLCLMLGMTPHVSAASSFCVKHSSRERDLGRVVWQIHPVLSLAIVHEDL